MIYAIVAVLALILDQAVKYWVTVSIPLSTGSVPVIKGVLSLVNVHNNGAAFGLMENANMGWLFVVLAVVFAAVVIVALSKNWIRDPMGRWTAVLVMAGAIGNCIDRVINGYVVDMFQLEFMNFAVFNVADIFITVCGILFCVYIIFGKDFGERAPAKAGEPGKKPGSAKKAPAEKPRRSVSAAPVAVDDEDEDVKVAPPKAKPAPPAEEIRTYQPRPKSVPAPAPAPVAERREQPAEEPVPTAKPVYFDPTSPFAEWEAPAKKAEPVAVEPAAAKPAAVRPAAIEPEPVFEPVAPAPPTDDGEFSLDDILAEFSDK